MNTIKQSNKTKPKNLTRTNLRSLNRTRLIVRLNLDSVLKSTLSGKLFHALTIRSAKKFERTQAEV